jgi:hypothetical protein
LRPTGGWKREAIVLALSVVLASGMALAQMKPDTASLKIEAIEVLSAPIRAFDKDGSAKATYGKLEWRGGLVLSSTSPNFGGWSGLAFDPDGKRFVAISDAGAWMTGELAEDGAGPKGIKSATIGPLKARGDKPLFARRYRDAEAIALEAGTLDSGTVLIAFEQLGRIGRFPVKDAGVGAPVEYLDIPPEVKAMRRDGFEAVTVLRAGRYKGSVVAFAEIVLDGHEGRHSGWIWVDGEPKPFSLDIGGGFEVTDAAALPDGGLLVLERRFTWSEGVRMRLRHVKAEELEPGAVVKGEVLIAADLGQEIDNMEGLAVREGKDGETLITLISDDNFNKLLQRTVLLEFALKPDGAEHAEDASATAQGNKSAQP